MKTFLLLMLAVWCAVAFRMLHANAREIGFTEDFALAPLKDEGRAKALEKLIPGTEEYYFYASLHAQQSSDFDAVHNLLKKWIERYGYTRQVNEIRNRQALLEYAENPDESLAHLKKTLNLHFDHQREKDAQTAALSTEFDLKTISIPELTRSAFSRYKNLQGIEDPGLDYLQHRTLDPDRRRDLLQRLVRPDIPGLAQLVVDDLNYRHSRGFGSFDIHRQLFRAQLDECVRLKPDLLNDSNFVLTYLTRLAPDDDTDIENDPEAKLAYLGRLWTFVEPLKPVHNSLKVHVLFHLLDHHRTQGRYDAALFMTYVKLPRNVGYIPPDYIERKELRGVRADMNADFSAATSFPTVGDDTPLVGDYLAHLFRDAKDYKPYEPYIRDQWLKRVFATTKILNGIGDPAAMEQWYSMLSPDEYRALRERIDIDFALTNPPVFGVDDPVSLDLEVKNVEKLIVKIFEINAFNFYKAKGAEVDTGINLDGLAATWERIFTYDAPPLRRVRRSFTFPEIDKPGVFIVEFIGNGKSSRALVRKGKLHFVEQATAAGHEFTLFDENREKCADAALWLSGHEYKSDADGVITVPYSTNPGEQTIILTEGLTGKGRVSLGSFHHRSEEYALTAGFHVDAESLTRGRTSRVVIRPALTLNGRPVSLALLEDVRLNLESTDRDGVTTRHAVTDFEIFEERDSVYEFRVPEGLSRITFNIVATVKSLSLNQEISLFDGRTFNVNQIDASDSVHDIFLSRGGNDYVLDVLGKNGEPKPDTPVSLTFKHRFFRDMVNVTLKTDASGRLRLSPLPDIEWFEARLPDGLSRRWYPASDRVDLPDAVHASADAGFRVAYTGETGGEPRLHYALLEVRGDAYVADRIEAVNYRDGFLEVVGLPAGDYELYLKAPGKKITVRITGGVETDGFLISDHRMLEVNNRTPLQIVSAEADAESVTVQLAYASEYTRVHVVATRYAPPFDLFAGLDAVRPPQPGHGDIMPPRAHYIAMRDIGDEYRYVLERRYAERFPGNMLNRPELLLNPWSIRKTETAVDQARAGEQPYASADADGAVPARYLSARAGAEQPVSGWNFDFLKHAAVVIPNLKPDENGRVVIGRDKLGPNQRLHLVAVEPDQTAYRQIGLGETELERRDLRMARKLDADKHFTERKKVSVIQTGESFELADMTSSDVEVYDTLGKAYQLLVTLSGEATLQEFRFILDWPEMDEAEKREKYSEYACHELNLFIYHKDKPFFESVVKPHLVHKKDKTFIDHWLLGDDLSEYRKAWAFNRLNIVEKILLLGRGGEAGPYVKQLYDLLPPDPDTYNRLFDVALKGREFEVPLYGAAAGAAMTADEMMSGGELDEAWGVALGRRLQASEMTQAKAAPPAPMAAMAEPAPEPESMLEEAAPMDRAEGFRSAKKQMARRRRDVEKREAVRRFFQKLDKTEEWAENNYHHLPIEQQLADLIRVNPFWNDYAASDPGKPFFSTNFAYATDNFAEMMLALSVLDLPFSAAEHATETSDTAFRLKAASPMVVFHKEIQPAAEADEAVPVMVGQNFFRVDDRYHYIDNERYDKFVTGEFLHRTAYGCQVVLSNPTSSPRKLTVMLQIPRGAMPLANGFYSKSIPVRMNPYGSWAQEYLFYFPETGGFGVYPAQVARNEAFVTGAEGMAFNVVAEFSEVDTASWAYVSRNGSDEQVLDFIRTHNPNRLELEKIAFRMRDKAFFGECIALLRSLHLYNDTLWSYGIHHNEPSVIAEYLKHSPYADQCGMVIASPLLTLDPVARHVYQHLEYKPLVNARAHRLGRRAKILNNRFYEQYQSFMRKLSYQPGIGDADLLATVYYLLLQDRVSEAMSFFPKIDPTKLHTRLQYDYAQVYLDFYAGKTGHARDIAAKYAEYPVPRWQKRFGNALSQLDEIEGKAATVTDEKDREQTHQGLADTSPSLDFEIESRRVKLRYRNLTTCTVNYYPMEIELLFSSNPFVKDRTGDFAFIRPNETAGIGLPAGETRYDFELPEKFHNANLMVEIVAEGIRKSRAYYANALDVRMVENYGRLTVTDAETGEPLPRSYVKIYARMNDGAVGFFKDGYTDLRGRFDYASLSTDELDRVERLAVLVMNDEFGAVIKEAGPPKR